MMRTGLNGSLLERCGVAAFLAVGFYTLTMISGCSELPTIPDVTLPTIPEPGIEEPVGQTSDIVLVRWP